MELLKAVTAAVPLQILPSTIPRAGAGLFIANDIQSGEEIFRSKPMVNCVADGMQNVVCDWCYTYQSSRLNTHGRFRGAEDPKVEVSACNGCKVCYYCSKVCEQVEALRRRRFSRCSKQALANSWT